MPNVAASPEAEIPVQAVAWRPCHRLIATRFPTVGLYDGIADPADLEVVFAIEALSKCPFKPGTDDLREAPSLAIIDALLARGATLQVETPDGRFTVQKSECLGACADAPVMLVNDRQMLSFMSNERLDELIQMLKAHQLETQQETQHHA